MPVLQIARQLYYRWLAEPVTDAVWDRSYLANAAFEAHCEDPEFGYRFLADEVRQAGNAACDPTIWRVASDNSLWPAFGKQRSRTSRPGTPANDDLFRRDFNAT